MKVSDYCKQSRIGKERTLLVARVSDGRRFGSDEGGGGFARFEGGFGSSGRVDS